MTAPLNFTLQDAAGHAVRLADFKGHPLVINFWATYCGPCRAEMPALSAIAEEYKSRHVAIVGISLDDPAADIMKFAAAQAQPIRYPLLVGLGHADMIAAYEADVLIPMSWVIRPDGTVQAKASGPQTKDWFEAQINATF